MKWAFLSNLQILIVRQNIESKMIPEFNMQNNRVRREGPNALVYSLDGVNFGYVKLGEMCCWDSLAFPSGVSVRMDQLRRILMVTFLFRLFLFKRSLRRVQTSPSGTFLVETIRSEDNFAIGACVSWLLSKFAIMRNHAILSGGHVVMPPLNMDKWGVSPIQQVLSG